MTPQFLRRKQAGEFLLKHFGFGGLRLLNKLAVTGGGPEFHKAGRMALYTPEALTEWAMSKIGPAQTSTAQNVLTREYRPRGRPRKPPVEARVEEPAT